ncbi:MAG TPA: DUF4143 domain-containing protein, partial [Crenotrichaceae bacterium]|nr:DUF4143 domain-containing protein [Crenotrichaceae bacterium]
MEILRLHPLAQCELARHSSRFIDALFEGSFSTSNDPRLQDNLIERILAGGYPAALVRSTARRRTHWYRDYIETLVQRDVRELSRIRRLDALPRLLSLAAGQTAQLLNISDLAAPFQVSRPTIRDYFTLLEQIFLLEVLPPWHSNRIKRLIKTPKLHLGDTGLVAAITGLTSEALKKDRSALGHLLETFVFQEIQRQASGHVDDFRFHHFRNKDGAEVDLVIERGVDQVAGIEVKASATVRSSDFRGLRQLKTAVGKQFTTGVVLYDGESCVRFGEGLYAVPVRLLWETR